MKNNVQLVYQGAVDLDVADIQERIVAKGMKQAMEEVVQVEVQEEARAEV